MADADFVGPFQGGLQKRRRRLVREDVPLRGTDAPGRVGLRQRGAAGVELRQPRLGLLEVARVQRPALLVGGVPRALVVVFFFCCCFEEKLGDLGLDAVCVGDSSLLFEGRAVKDVGVREQLFEEFPAAFGGRDVVHGRKPGLPLLQRRHQHGGAPGLRRVRVFRVRPDGPRKDVVRSRGRLVVRGRHRGLLDGKPRRRPRDGLRCDGVLVVVLVTPSSSSSSSSGKTIILLLLRLT
mmetsp:Transcript_17563/g.56994  ORF Transcript_17563/g.56994 Transcript_17563/m.56994 type:complete len:237 (-) Transcript_17563:1284-1994(-)